MLIHRTDKINEKYSSANEQKPYIYMQRVYLQAHSRHS